jgi:NADH dehydrogenase (ubiquinone) Fe-S protein 4
MIKAKIYIPTKTSMQSGLGKGDKWVFKFETENTGINPLMGWETSSNTLSELNLEFSTKELAIEYAKKNKIDFEIIEPQKRKTIKKSYANNFHKQSV